MSDVKVTLPEHEVQSKPLVGHGEHTPMDATKSHEEIHASNETAKGVVATKIQLLEDFVKKHMVELDAMEDKAAHNGKSLFHNVLGMITRAKFNL